MRWMMMAMWVITVITLSACDDTNDASDTMDMADTADASDVQELNLGPVATGCMVDDCPTVCGEVTCYCSGPPESCCEVIQVYDCPPDWGCNVNQGVSPFDTERVCSPAYDCNEIGGCCHDDGTCPNVRAGDPADVPCLKAFTEYRCGVSGTGEPCARDEDCGGRKCLEETDDATPWPGLCE